MKAKPEILEQDLGGRPRGRVCREEAVGVMGPRSRDWRAWNPMQLGEEQFF